MVELRDADGSGRLLPVLTPENIQSLKGSLQAANTTIEAQAAEIKGLREALEDVRKELDFGSGASIEAAYHTSNQALSRTPAEWGEGERLREAVVRAAKKRTRGHSAGCSRYRVRDSRLGAPCSCGSQALEEAFASLEAWEGGK